MLASSNVVANVARAQTRTVARRQPLITSNQVVGWLARRAAAVELGVIVAALGVAYLLLFMDRTLAQYVDESDNLLGGQIIARGYRLYVDYFSQHMPLPYFIAALGTRLGLHDLVDYRVFFSVLILLFFGYICLQFRRRLSPVFLVVLVLTFGVGHSMFSGYMLLADQFFAFALLLILLLLLVDDVDFSLSEQMAVSLCCFAAIQSTLISVYPILMVAAYYVIRKGSRHLRGGPRLMWKRESVFVAILLTPHLVLGIWLVTQGMAGALGDQAIRFNEIYYSRYDLGGDPISILRKSTSDFLGIAIRYLRPDALREVETFLLVSNISAVVILWKKRDLLFASFYVGLVILSRMRGDGYHGSPYFLVSFASIAIVLTFAAEAGLTVVKRRLVGGYAPPRPGQRLVLGELVAGMALLGYVGLAGVFYHDVAGFYLRLPRGGAVAPEIQASYATVVEAATEPSDRIWAAPFEPYVYLKSGRLPASPYWYYHPWMSDSPEVREGVLRDLQTAHPPVVIFRADKEIPWDIPLPTLREFGAPVYVYIRSAYIAIDEQDPVLRDVFVRRDQVDVVRARLVQHGIIRSSVP